MAATCFLALCVLSCMLPFSFSSSLPAASDKKVNVDLYYETLCPGCALFMVQELPKLFTKGLIDIVNLNLVPFGNANFINNTMTCEHGANECLLNTIHSCAINVWPKVNKHYAFIYCVEYFVLNNKFNEWESCYQELGFDPNPISECMISGMGEQLQMAYADQTQRLWPPYVFVPWMVVDNEPLRENTNDFITFVCAAYEGPMPEACIGKTKQTSKGKTKNICYAKGTPAA